MTNCDNNDKSAPERKRTPYKREFIDFKTLTNLELKRLANKWETDVRRFEIRLQSYMANPRANEEKIARQWQTGKSLWRRVVILERWLIRNKFKR